MMNKKSIVKMCNEFSRKQKLKKYYRSYNNQDKTMISDIVDYFVVLFTLFLISFIYFAIITKSLLISITISVVIIFIVFIVLFYFKRQQRIKKIKIINEKVALNEIIKELTNKSPYEFSNFMKDVFEKSGITELTVMYENEIDMIGIYNRKKIGIKIFQLKEDYKVSLKDLKSFFIFLRKHNINSGIVFTTSFFLKEVDTLVKRIGDTVNVQLINKDEILDLYSKANMYPNIKYIQKTILDIIEDSKKEVKKKRLSVVSSSKKIFTYFLTGIIISWMGNITPYSLYYRVASIILYLLGILSIIVMLSRKIQRFRFFHKGEYNER
ncbi:restriction endonuclease [Abyssisolibacter fermentans]|uniref:restriction endonuclease n=1 Tax=Abyssisolibacter fermentans TaxID=1766203 RepID=UPI00083111ED|nr:restriction endonuclease [Abyssisolibacter fermentans]